MPTKDCYVRAQPSNPKRDLESLREIQEAPNEIVSAEADAINNEKSLPHQVGTELGDGSQESSGKPRQRGPGFGKRQPWSCSPEFLRSQDVKPHFRANPHKKKPGDDLELDPNIDYPEYDEDDDDDDYSNFTPPHGWPWP